MSFVSHWYWSQEWPGDAIENYQPCRKMKNAMKYVDSVFVSEDDMVRQGLAAYPPLINLTPFLLHQKKYRRPLTESMVPGDAGVSTAKGSSSPQQAFWWRLPGETLLGASISVPNGSRFRALEHAGKASLPRVCEEAFGASEGVSLPDACRASLGWLWNSPSGP